MQDNVVRQQEKRIIELIQRMVEMENERFQIIEQKATVHNS